MKIRHFIFILSVINFVLVGCNSKQEASSRGIWIGNYSSQIWQHDLPILLDLGEKEGDSLFWLSWASTKKTMTPIIQEDSIFWVDSFKYHPTALTQNMLVWEFRRDSLKENHVPFVFYRPAETSFSLAPEKIKEMLIGKAWISTAKKPNQWFRSNELHWFTTDHRFIQRSYTYKGKSLFEEWEAQCYKIDSYKDLRLMILSKDFSDCQGNNHALRQILDLTANTLSIQFADRGKIRKEVFKSTTAKVNLPPPVKETFRFCNSTKILPYFYSEARYKGGRKAIKQHFQQQFSTPTPYSDLSGYLTIRFFINCEGDFGKFEVLGTNMDYQPMAFPPDLVKELILQVKNLSDWIPGKRNKDPIDSQFFLSFKYKDGQLSEIVP